MPIFPPFCVKCNNNNNKLDRYPVIVQKCLFYTSISSAIDNALVSLESELFFLNGNDPIRIGLCKKSK